ncbi:MAG TPA: outer membrane protein assembly factor BamA [Salinisphaeraceae bacterium]|nr:outer membrane protein assembly factor BamA [Salinisphaeraceae bacterium]
MLLLLVMATAWGQDTFRISDIRVEGVQRLEPGTVLSYLPLNIGDQLTPERSQRAIKALYATDMFDNVQLSRSGSTLIVRVQERPQIERLSIEGSKKISSKQLMESMTEAGLARGDLFRESLLDRVLQDLRKEYYSNGYYSVEIDPAVTRLANNRVAIDIRVNEGPIARIRDINIVGNKHFSDEELKEEVMSLEASRPFYTHLLTFWRSYDRYSRQQLLGDLEALNSFYQNRGYIRFNIESVQVSLSPDRRDIFLTISVDEGEQYTLADYRFAGDMIVPETSVEQLVTVQEGEVFNRADVATSAEQISSGLADFGYAFADVEPLTRVNDDNHTVDLTFHIEPGKRAYVRRITFSGNKQTDDSTLRREMRQFEGAPFSRRAVQRSRTRLARLPYIQDVDVSSEPVPGTDDLVDVNYDVEERPAGTLQFGVGYSDAEGFLVNGNVSHSNIFGTGNEVSIGAETNSYAKSVSARWTDPYFTADGVSRTISGYYRKTERLNRISSSFDMESQGLAMTFRLPVSEFSAFRLGVGVDRNEITQERYFTDSDGVRHDTMSKELLHFIEENGRKATTVEARTGWQRDTRDRSYFATRGSYTGVNFDFKIPGSDLEYYIASLEHERYFRFGDWVPFLSDKFVLSTDANISYTDMYGSGTDVPPYDHLFAGGPDSVRGFRAGGIGPRDSRDYAYGGQFRTTLQTELSIPTFTESDGKTTRLALFYDIGNVFEDIDDFKASELRSSAGAAFYWFTPFFGLLRISYAPYAHSKEGDETDRFQFSFGIGF